MCLAVACQKTRVCLMCVLQLQRQKQTCDDDCKLHKSLANESNVRTHQLAMLGFFTSNLGLGQAKCNS